MDTSILIATAAGVTKAVDFTRNAIDPLNALPKWLWNVEAFVLGILAAVAGNLNMLVGQKLGTVITGLAIGGFASGFHEVFDLFSSKAKGV